MDTRGVGIFPMPLNQSKKKKEVIKWIKQNQEH